MVFLSGLLVLKILEANMGTSVNETITDVAIVIVTTQPSGLKRMPVIPPSMVNGRNTATIVSVDAITAKLTSFVP